ncbi:MAG: peptidoglycan DD-metalloendopeptidase family protein [Patescibacteria group bacterium]
MLMLRAKYSYFVRISRVGILVASVFLGAMFPAVPAQASMLSYFGGWWTTKTVSLYEDKVEPSNSQTIAFLEAATNFDPNPAKGGGDITIIDDSALLPEVGPSGTIADVELGAHQGNVSLYVVRSGDTLTQIAKMFDVSPNTILWANDLPRGSVLRVGQSLVILPVSGVQHIVKKGDTVPSIAKKYKGSVEEIRDFNDLSVTSVLAIGDVVIVPDGEEATVSAPLGSNTTSRFSALPAYKGYYTHPLPTMRKRTQGIHGYNGVDLGAPTGASVVAAADGVVMVSRFRTAGNPWFGGYGNYIVVQHNNNTQTLYAHLSAVYVPVGAQVSSGQPIGEVGSTGKSTGPHLHFEVRGAKNPF